MDVFISWSGPRSKAVAQALESWLRLVIQAVEPWISADMDKGRRWGDEIAGRLEQSKVGIICLTPDNLEEKWIHFEAGALSKTKDASVCTLLVGIQNENDVEYPLAQFQHTKAEKNEMYRLVETINKCVEKCGEKSLPESLLRDAFETYWPRLEKQLQAALLLPSAPAKVERTEGEVLQEVLKLVRNQDRRLERLETEKAREATLLEALRQRKGSSASLADLKLPLPLRAFSRSLTLGQKTQDPLDIDLPSTDKEE